MAIGPTRFRRDTAAQGDGRPRYARELAAVLIVKACALFVIWHVWFADALPDSARRDGIAAHILPAPAASTLDARPHARP